LLTYHQAFGAIRERAHRTLGDVTLTAIVDRVLLEAAERFPMLTALTLNATRLRDEDLQERAVHFGQGHLEEAIRFVLVELLRVLGHLTAEVLTPRCTRSWRSLGRQHDPERNGAEGGKP